MRELRSNKGRLRTSEKEKKQRHLSKLDNGKEITVQHPWDRVSAIQSALRPMNGRYQERKTPFTNANKKSGVYRDFCLSYGAKCVGVLLNVFKELNLRFEA